MPIPVLVGISGQVRGLTWTVPPPGLRIGRQRGNEIRIDDAGISRQHARIVLYEDALWIEDLGSRNGVDVNEVRVAGQRRLAVGDRIVLGDHVLEVCEGPTRGCFVAQPEPAGPPEAPSLPPPTRGSPPPPSRWRGWLLVLAGTVVLLLVVWVVRSSRGRVRPTEPGPADPVADLLRSTSEPEPPAPASTGIAALLGDVPGPAAGLPPPSQAGSSSAELVDRGHQLHASGQLHDALVAYTQARMLDPSCEVCLRRVERVEREIDQAIADRFDAGLRAWDDLQYDQAIHAWETVLLLSPDPGSRANREARVYLEEARAKLKHPF